MEMLQKLKAKNIDKTCIQHQHQEHAKKLNTRKTAEMARKKIKPVVTE
jgi:hypothetical protein